MDNEVSGILYDLSRKRITFTHMVSLDDGYIICGVHNSEGYKCSIIYNNNPPMLLNQLLPIIPILKKYWNEYPTEEKNSRLITLKAVNDIINNRPALYVYIVDIFKVQPKINANYCDVEFVFSS